MTTSRKRSMLWHYGALALFCGLPLLLIAGTVFSVIDATQASDEAARNRATTSLIVAQLEKHRARAAKPVDTASLYLTSASDTLARAEIQERANKLAMQAGGRLAEVQLTATPEQEAAGTVAIQVTLDIGNKGLLDMLYTIESGLPLLDVTSLSVERRNGQNDGDATGDGSLHVDMTIQGHWRKSTG